MENRQRKYMHCKGTLPGTNKKCGAELCETDGEFIYLRLESGRELVIQPLKSKGFGIICEMCGYETIWYKNNL
jgi:hypothetical protein